MRRRLDAGSLRAWWGVGLGRVGLRCWVVVLVVVVVVEVEVVVVVVVVWGDVAGWGWLACAARSASLR